MKIIGLFILLLLGSLKGISQINPHATLETKRLYKGLQQLSGKYMLFGHQDALSYGLNKDKTRWIGEKDRSDVKTVSGDYPAVIGYDLGHLELDSLRNLDKVPFDEIRKNIQDTYKRGGVNTISWHPNNPTNPKKTSWDKEEFTIRKILNNPTNKANYQAWLDKVADFLLSLKTADGKLIPVIFRPFHEHTGSWFWWGADHCTPEEYIGFWKYSIDYLLKTRQVNNILIGYSTDVFKDKAHYLERYPGHDYADILGFDSYHRNAPKSNEHFVSELRRMLMVLKEVSGSKPFAITEMGLEQVTEKDWWTNIIMPAIDGSGLSYFLVWRNGYDTHYYAPFEGQASADDFNKMIKTKKVLLSKGLKKQKIYKPK